MAICEGVREKVMAGGNMIFRCSSELLYAELTLPARLSRRNADVVSAP